MYPSVMSEPAGKLTTIKQLNGGGWHQKSRTYEHMTKLVLEPKFQTLRNYIKPETDLSFQHKFTVFSIAAD